MKPAVVMARCRVCGRKLTHPVSVKHEIGPVCLKRLERIQHLDEWIEVMGLDEKYHEQGELCHITGDDCTGDPVFCEECPVMVPEMEEPEPTLPTCPSCGKASPNPRYCPSCGSPMRARPFEVVA